MKIGSAEVKMAVRSIISVWYFSQPHFTSYRSLQLFFCTSITPRNHRANWISSSSPSISFSVSLSLWFRFCLWFKATIRHRVSYNRPLSRCTWCFWHGLPSRVKSPVSHRAMSENISAWSVQIRFAILRGMDWSPIRILRLLKRLEMGRLECPRLLHWWSSSHWSSIQRMFDQLFLRSDSIDSFSLSEWQVQRSHPVESCWAFLATKKQARRYLRPVMSTKKLLFLSNNVWYNRRREKLRWWRTSGGL